MVAVIARSENHSASLVVEENGDYGPELLDLDGWRMSVGDVSFPIRQGLKWRKTFRGRHSQVVKRDEVTILFEAVMPSTTPERPLFKARSLDGGIMEKTFQSNSPNDLERMWLGQNVDNLRMGGKIDGKSFLGLDNSNFARHLRHVTPLFVSDESDLADKFMRGSYKPDSMSVRSERRWSNLLFERLKHGGSSTHTSATRCTQI